MFLNLGTFDETYEKRPPIKITWLFEMIAVVKGFRFL